MIVLGKVALITGSGGAGSGRAEALRFAREGALVVVNDVDVPGGRETVRQIQAQGGTAKFYPANVGDREEAQALVHFARDTFGRLDILVNNASAPYRPRGLTEGWFDAVQVDLLGAMYTTAAAIEIMRSFGGGAILQVGSTSAVGHGRKHSGSPGYDVAKAGIMRLATCLAPLRDQANIRVNCIVPDWVASEEVRVYCEALSPQQRREMDVPGVLITLDELANTVLGITTDETIAGRVLVWWSGHPPRFIPVGDPGYERLE